MLGEQIALNWQQFASLQATEAPVASFLNLILRENLCDDEELRETIEREGVLAVEKERKKLCDFTNPDQVLNVRSIIRACFLNLDN